MSALDTLIRLHRWQLDERRRQLGDLEQLAAKLRLDEARLVAEQQAEQQVAAGSIEASSSYGGYVRRVIERRQKIVESIAAANRVSRRRRRLDQIQQRALDEIGIEAFRRRGS